MQGTWCGHLMCGAGAQALAVLKQERMPALRRSPGARSGTHHEVPVVALYAHLLRTAGSLHTGLLVLLPQSRSVWLLGVLMRMLMVKVKIWRRARLMGPNSTTRPASLSMDAREPAHHHTGTAAMW